MLALFNNPGERRRLAENLDSLLPAAVEEMLRYTSPVIYMRRTAIRDAELGGTKDSSRRQSRDVLRHRRIGTRACFAEPDRFDVGRAPNDHIAFGGGGTHFCLGAHLARLEIQVMLREIFNRLPDIQPAGPAQWVASNFISGLRRLPVKFSACGV